MANSDTPFGLRPVRHRNGAPYNGAVEPMYIASTYNSGGMFTGDLVVKVSAGSNTTSVSAPGVGSFPPGTLPQIQLAAVTDGTYASGVIVGFAANPSNLEQKHNPTSTERIALVCTDPDIVYEIQADGDLTETMIGLNATFIRTHSGSTTTGFSGEELDTGTTTAPAADASLMLRIVGMVNREDNDTTAANQKALVVINMHSDLSTGDGDGALGI